MSERLIYVIPLLLNVGKVRGRERTLTPRQRFVLRAKWIGRRLWPWSDRSDELYLNMEGKIGLFLAEDRERSK